MVVVFGSMISQDINISCVVYANPEPEVYWTFTNSMNIESIINATDSLLEDNVINSTLMLKGVRFEDRGLYNCIAANEYDVVSAQTDVQVIGKCFLTPKWFRSHFLYLSST